MGDYSGSTSVSASETDLFDYLSDVGNLPKYFARMTSAAPGDGEEVKTTAKMPDGAEVQGNAWFRVDPSAKHIEWGSEGPSDYRGLLDVTADGGGCTVTVSLHTTRGEGAEVEDGIQETLANIKRLVEQGAAG